MCTLEWNWYNYYIILYYVRIGNQIVFQKQCTSSGLSNY